MEQLTSELRLSALQDKNSSLYKAMCNMLRECEAQDVRKRALSKYVVIPFHVDDKHVAALEKQFSVQIKIRGFRRRIVGTPRVQALIFMLDDYLTEMIGGFTNRILMIDGDIVSMAALGYEGKIIERTNATYRLNTGYFMEGDVLRMSVGSRSSNFDMASEVLNRELIRGGGEHYWPFVREDGPRVDKILVNHFKSVAGPHQLAWLAHKRGAIVEGVIFFQNEMLIEDEGELSCFPGRYYIDRRSDTITLVPEDDATMSLTHPYSSWKDIITNNVIVVGGKEFLCEKYNSLQGIVCYTLKVVGDDYAFPEVLRSHYLNPADVSVVELTFPSAKYSAEGVPVGFERKTERIMSHRFEKVMGRLMTHTSPVVTPADAFVVLMDYNNVVVSSWDSLTVADRMEVASESGLALALALHVNWTRHSARGTFNTLLSAVKMRHQVKDASMMQIAMVAISAWWGKPSIGGKVNVGSLPDASVIDWCGNDFSVLVKDVDPWIEIVQATGQKSTAVGKEFPWLPRCKVMSNKEWIDGLCKKAREVIFKPDVGIRLSTPYKLGSYCAKSPASTLMSSASTVVGSVVGSTETTIGRSEVVLTRLRSLARQKMGIDQGALNIPTASCEMVEYETANTGCIGDVPVPDVDVVAAISSDFLMVNGGPMEYDAPAVGHRISEVEMSKNTQAVYSINDSRRAIPKEFWVRDPKVNMGVEGVRSSSQATVMAAAFKRNVAVPANRGTVDLDAVPSMMVDKVIDTCYRDDWKDILNKHLESGLWEPNYDDIDVFLGNTEELKMKKLLGEFFMEGEVNLSTWQLMAKGKVKPSREVGGKNAVSHPQTILFQAVTSVNAMYSPMVRRFKKVVDECLRPEISLNSQRSESDQEKWYNSLESRRRAVAATFAYACDIKTYDRAQEHVALRFSSAFYAKHGLSQDTLDKWEVIHGSKRAISMMFDLVFNIVLEGVSGIFDTLWRNGIINLASIVVSNDLRRADIVMLDIKGDDVDAEFSRPMKVETAVEYMGKVMNLSAKFMTADVRYMCKQFRLRIHGVWYFVSDPWSKVQTLCTPLKLTSHEDDIHERYISFKDGLRHYQNEMLVCLVAEAAQMYYGLEKPCYGFARALSMFRNERKGKHMFVAFYNSPRRVN